MDDFKDHDKNVVLKTGETGVARRFVFSACTGANLNDGSLPYGETIESVTVTVYDADGDTVTDVVSASTVSGGLVVVMTMKYPTTSGEGQYTAHMLLTLAVGGGKLPFVFERIFAEAVP